MIRTFYHLAWLFLIYSFLGWGLETVTAALKQKRFVNKGLVNGPFCIIYGFTTCVVSVFFYELHGMWLFTASAIMSVVIEWVVGHLIEKLYHERWWDYSERKWNLDGYVCLSMTCLWGVLCTVAVTWCNRLLIYVYDWIPSLAGKIIVWSFFAILAVDILATMVILSGRSKNLQKWENVDIWLDNVSSSLGKKVYRTVNRRIVKAYPSAKRKEAEAKSADIFAYGCGFYKIVLLFFVGALLGDIVETIFCRITAGVWMSRSSLVWGPFSIVWGGAIAAATLLLYKYKDRSYGFMFLAGTLLGGAYEYMCSVLSEIVFGKVFWDYSAMKYNLGGRINLVYCFFWGIAAVVWMKMLYPKISARIEKIPMKPGKIMTWVIVVFLCVNMAVSALALLRSGQREEGVEATSGWQQVMDERFTDERLEKVYPNMIDVK